MDFRQLRNLVYVARYASFGIAADKLNATQPAISKSIRTLEQSVGVRLLDRNAHGVQPTEYGRRLIEYGEVMLVLAEEARNEIDAMRGARRSHLRVGAIATIVRTVVPIAARRFLTAYPDVNLTLNEELSPALQDQLLNGAIDLAIMSRPRDFPDEELGYRELLAIPMDIVADRNHPLTRRERVSLADLTCYQWILPSRSDPDRLALDALFAARQLPIPQPVCESSSSRFQVSMLAGSPWLSYLTRTSDYTSGPLSQFVPLRLESPTWSRSVGIACRHRRVDRPVVTRFIKEIEAACREVNLSHR